MIPESKFSIQRNPLSRLHPSSVHIFQRRQIKKEEPRMSHDERASEEEEHSSEEHDCYLIPIQRPDWRSSSGVGDEEGDKEVEAV